MLPVIILMTGFILLSASCAANTDYQPEYIHPPVALSVEDKGGFYEVSFQSYNIENGFSGYGLFTGSDSSSASAAPADELPSSPDFFCSTTTTPDYNSNYTVQVGGTEQSGYDCYLPSFTLSSGMYVAVRARVERDEEPWSDPAVKQTP